MTPSDQPRMALDADTLLAHGAWLAKFARALVANESEVDDVVQQTFVTALEKPPRHGGNVRGWLGTVARNVVRSNARSASARVAREVAVPPPPPVESPEEAVERTELRRMVVETVLALEEPYRSAIILRFFEEEEIGAIARLTGSVEETVRTRVRRGVLRVRQLLERKVSDRSRDADEGAAARALLLARLGELAAGGGAAAGAGAGGATGSAAAARSAARAGGKLTRVVTTRRILVVATAVLAGTAGWWWSRPPGAERRPAEDAVAARDPTATDRASRDLPRPAVVAERATEPVAPPPPPPSPPPSRFARRGTIRGVVTDPAGDPIAGARVWAIPSASHEAENRMPEFGSSAKLEAERDGTRPTGDNWIGASCGPDGRYEFSGLSTIPGWTIGAYEAGVGAMLSDSLSFDHDHREIVVDVRLIPGVNLRGSVRDADGVPLGNAQVILHVTCPKHQLGVSLITDPFGARVGEFRAPFFCGDPIEIECRAPGYVPAARTRVVFTPHAAETRVDFALKRRPGNVVQGRVVDAAGLPLQFEPVLARITTASPSTRASKLTVRAIEAGATNGAGVVEGRIDFVRGTYDVVVADDFHGSLELRIGKVVVGTAPLPDRHAAPDLPCDVGLLPQESTATTFAVRFVDAETKEPIDLEHERFAPQASDGASNPARIRTDGDARHGVVIYGCEPGLLKIEAEISGYVTGVYVAEVSGEPQREPMTVEVPRANAGVRGVVFHADGRPFAMTPIDVYRVTPEGFKNSTGPYAVTNPEGEFEFTALAKGDHVVVVSGQPDEAPAVVRFVAADPIPEIEMHTTAGATTRFRIVLKAPVAQKPRMLFTIVDGDGLVLGNLHRGWELLASPPDEVAVTLGNGHYTALIARDGYREDPIEFDIPGPDTIEVPLEPLESESK